MTRSGAKRELANALRRRMTTNMNSIMYANELNLLSAALRSTEGIEYDAGSGPAARTLTQRINRVRVLLRKENPEGLSPYDKFLVKCRGDKVVIILREPLNFARVKEL